MPRPSWVSGASRPDFGNNFGDVNVFEALTNVGYGANRNDFACTELSSALKIAAIATRFRSIR